MRRQNTAVRSTDLVRHHQPIKFFAITAGSLWRLLEAGFGREKTFAGHGYLLGRLKTRGFQ